jgi:hypothetical protein
MLHGIRKIISVVPYTVVCEWTNGEVSALKMESEIIKWAEEPQSMYKQLLNKDVFVHVKLDAESKTLYWDGLASMRELDWHYCTIPT